MRQLRAIQRGKRRAALKRAIMADGMAEGAHARKDTTAQLAASVKATARAAHEVTRLP